MHVLFIFKPFSVPRVHFAATHADSYYFYWVIIILVVIDLFCWQRFNHAFHKCCVLLYTREISVFIVAQNRVRYKFSITSGKTSANTM